MPKKLDGTYLVDVKKIHYDKLDKDFIKADTETIDGKFYQLSRGNLLILKLYTMGHVWQTIRPWNLEKEKYYKELLGEEVYIEITQTL